MLPLQILDVSVTHDKCGKRRPAYLIHFLRWNSRFLQLQSYFLMLLLSSVPYNNCLCIA